jgi:hypothetical protein
LLDGAQLARTVHGRDADHTEMTTSNLSLIRLAIVRFTPPPTQGDQLAGDVSGVAISTLLAKPTEDERAVDVLFAATMPLRFRPKITRENLLVVPERERSRRKRSSSMSRT